MEVVLVEGSDRVGWAGAALKYRGGEMEWEWKVLNGRSNREVLTVDGELE